MCKQEIADTETVQVDMLMFVLDADHHGVTVFGSNTHLGRHSKEIS